MALPNLYSRRKRLANKKEDDVYQYDTISGKLRNQILHIFDRWNKGFYSYRTTSSNPIYDSAVSALRTELGVQTLHGRFSSDADVEFHEWFTKHSIIDELLDAIEICVRLGSYWYDQSRSKYPKFSEDFDELNARLLEAGFGFQIEGGQIIEIGSTFIHKEITVPTLYLLSEIEYKNAEDEFRQAYQEFNQGNYDDCIHDCCNAFESVLKIILTKKGWKFSVNDTAKKLLEIAFSNDLIPSYMQNEFTGLRTILESGVPTVRNKDGGHGAGVNQRKIPKHIAAFQLHQTAAAIKLLIEAAR